MERETRTEGGRGKREGKKDTLDVTVLNCNANRVCSVHPSSESVDA